MAYSYNIIKERNEELRLKIKQIEKEKKKIKSLNEEIIEKQKEKKEQDILMGMLLEKTNWKIIK